VEPIPTHCPTCGDTVVQRRPGGKSRIVNFCCDRCGWLRKERVADMRALGLYVEYTPNCRKHRLPLAYKRANGRSGCFDCLVEDQPA
jgi:hypothetical protein